jgi:predicted nucleic acid-binding protein
VSIDEAIALYGELDVNVMPTSAPRVVPGDADDDQVIAAAIAGRVDLIVSGDRHLLSLGGHRAIRIVTPAQTVRIIATA